MKRFISALLILIIVIVPYNTLVFASETASGINDLETYSKGIYMINTDTGTVVFQKNENTRMYPASLTKIMTALVVLTDCKDLSEMVTIPDMSVFDDVYEQGGVNIALKTGEEISVRDLLYATMLPSACDAASALAYYMGDGDIQNFCDRMNGLAKEIGATDSNFENAHGLHTNTHYSTPHDLALIVQKALEYPEFVEIISSTKYKIPATNKSEARAIKYTIEMLQPTSDYFYENMIGVKSGYTQEAGRCLASTATKDGYHYLLVLMGANLDQPEVSKDQENLAYTDTKDMYEYAFNNFEIKEVVTAGQALTQIPVTGEKSKKDINLVSASTVKVIVDKNQEITYDYNVPESVEASTGSESVGELIVKSGGNTIATVTLYREGYADTVEVNSTQEPIKKTDKGLNQKWFNKILIVFSIIIAVLIVLIYISRIRQNNKRRRMAKKYPRTSR